MSLFVIDNQEDYSGHSIYFVETTYPREVVEAVVKLRDYKILGEVLPTWWEGDTDELEELVSFDHLWAGDGGFSETARSLPTPLLRSVLDYAKGRKVTEWNRGRLLPRIAELEALVRARETAEAFDG